MFLNLVLAFPVVLFGIAISATVVATVLITAAILIATVILGVLLKPKNPINSSFLTALEQQLNPDAYRTFTFGKCPTGNDVRFWEVYASTGFDQIIASATHKLSEFDEFYINGRLVTFAGANSSGAATGRAAIGTFGTGDYSPADTVYAGSLTKTNMNEGVTGTTISGTTGSGSLWTSSSSMTYCSFYRLKWNYSQKALPTGIPSNTVNVGKGCPVYDPRKDTTIGGSGSHRANDNTTWQYTPTDSNGIEIGRNNALQVLTYLLGWYKPNVQTGVQMLLFGRGVNPIDIDYAQFIAAANECEAAHYYSDASGNTGDDHNTNEGVLTAAAQGFLIDAGGLWGYYPAVDDTGTVDVALNDDNVVGAVQWIPKSPISESFNSIGGHFIDNSSITAYQPQAYPTVSNATYLSQDNNMPKRITLDFSSVQDPSQAQVLARIALNRSRLTGQFSATFNYAAIKTKIYGIVTLNFAAFGFVNKVFRVISYSINPNGGIDLILREESSLVYTGGTVTTYVPRSSGQVFDPTIPVALTGLAATATAVASDGTMITDGLNVSWTTPVAIVAAIELQFKQHSASVWTPHSGLIGADVTNIIIPNLLLATSYDIQARTWTVYNLPGPWASITQSTVSNTTATQNQIFNQNADPALTQTVNDGAIWTNSSTGKTYMRLGGSWILFVSPPATMADGDIIYDSTSSVINHPVPIPMNALGHVDIFIFGAGGGASATHGGGGSGYSYTHLFAVTPGTTVLTVNIGSIGLGTLTGPTAGGGASVSATGLTTMTVSGGGAGGSSGGTGGTAAGGATTNTAGEAGSLGTAINGGANLGTGGIGPTGGARQTASNTKGNPPGGGGSADGSTHGANGAVARVVILTRT